MKPTVGFVILSYDKPEQLQRLAARLTAIYQAPPIVCHHNFDQCAVDFRKFPSNVSVCRPHIRTRWADISCIHAARLALRKLYESSDPDWFFLLSGTDYPVAPAARVLNELDQSHFDAYMEHFRVDAPPAAGFPSTAYERYIAWTFRLRNRLVLNIGNPRIVLGFTPFSAAYTCYAGDHWITANRRCARVILDDAPPRLIKHLSRRATPEECFYQTVLCNHPELKISPDPKRYRDWSRGGGSPKTLEAADISSVVDSGAWFARKFEMRRFPEAMDSADEITRVPND